MSNRTKGATRRGNRTGRPVYPKGEETYKAVVVLSLGHIEIAKALGGGYPARGIRYALTQMALQSVGGANG